MKHDDSSCECPKDRYELELNLERIDSAHIILRVHTSFMNQEERLETGNYNVDQIESQITRFHVERKMI